MNSFFINGNKVGIEYAKARFVSFHERVTGLDVEEIAGLWNQCQSCEETRDSYLPDNLEIIQAN